MALAGKIMTEEVKEMVKLLMEVINRNQYFRSSYVFVSNLASELGIWIWTNLPRKMYTHFPHFTATIPVCEKMELVKV